MKRPSWTSRIPSGNAPSSLCSTFFLTDSFIAFDKRQLNNSSVREKSEVNVKYVATWLKQWKRNKCKKCSKSHSLHYIRCRMFENGKNNFERSCLWFCFILKTDYLHLKTSYKKEIACRWKQLKWNNLSFHGDRLSWKLYHMINIADSVSEKIT